MLMPVSQVPGGGATELVECIAWHWPSYSHSYLNFTNNIAVAARLWTLVKGQRRRMLAYVWSRDCSCDILAKNVCGCFLSLSEEST